MVDFGENLRLAREERGVSLRQISAKTKISLPALEALERNDVSKLPGGIFSRAFVRAYAVEVGLDPDSTVKEFMDRFHLEQPAQPQRRITPDDELALESNRRAVGLALQAVVVLAIVAGIFAFFFRGRDDVNPTASAAPPPVPRAEVATSSAATTAPAAAPAVDDVLRATGPMRLDIHTTGPCWVKLTADGQTVIARLMQRGQKESLTVRDSAVISIGDAGSFSFSIDGRPGRPLGGTGEVKTARITRETLAEFLR